MPENRTLDAYHIKIIALLFMVLDHLHTYLFYAKWPTWITILPRFVAPVFLYLMIEGFHYTHNKKNYALRLFIAAMIMGAGNIIINLVFHNVDRLTGKFTIYSILEGNNIFLTLALLFMCIWAIDNIQNGQRRLINIFVFFICGIISLIAEGGIYLLPLAIMFQLCYHNKKRQCFWTFLFCMLLLAKAIFSWLSGGTGESLWETLCFDAEWAMVFVIPFIMCYNGKRGKNTKASKYLFYIVYPAHLWILMILRFILN